MSASNNEKNTPFELPLFDDLTDDDKPAGAQKSGASGRKGASARPDLPDFSDENDRVNLLPPKKGLSDDGSKPRAGGASDDDDVKVPSAPRKRRTDTDGGKKDEELTPSKPKEVIKAEKRGAKTPSEDKDRKKDQKAPIKKEETPQTSKGAKTVFIICAILLAPFAAVLVLAVFALFALVFTAAILIAGLLALALIALVVAGVVLALTGITYGLIQMVSKSGFAFYAGQYELGLGLAITGITIIFSSLLYAGATSFIPFIVRQLGRLLKFLWKKVRELFKKVYHYTTHI